MTWPNGTDHTNYQRLKRVRARHRKAGLCIDGCRRRATRGGRCAECYERAKPNRRKLYADKRARGECVDCPRQARPGKSRCKRCARIEAEQHQRRKLRREYAAADAAQIAAIVTSRPGEGAYG